MREIDMTLEGWVNLLYIAELTPDDELRVLMSPGPVVLCSHDRPALVLRSTAQWEEFVRNEDEIYKLLGEKISGADQKEQE